MKYIKFDLLSVLFTSEFPGSPLDSKDVLGC